MSRAFERLSRAVQYQVVNGLGWPGLRPVQEAATDAIVDGDNCVVLAPTAGGKTEAAFLPLLSLMEQEDWAATSVLYLAPIRALLNNQETRLQSLAGLIGRRAGKWHGDVGASARKRLVQEPADVLATTPESLEAMLLSASVPYRRVLGQIRAVVVDEVHAFAADDRGAHLVALLERVARITGRDVQRIGLSATVGDPDVIVDWLSGSSTRGRRVVNPGGPRKAPHISVDYVGSLENAALMIERLHPGRRRLVFVDSRKRVEELGHLLGGRGVDVHLSHSSLALSERTGAERAFQEGNDCVIVATSALELGLDVGDLDHVLQIDAPSTVSSFLQRMGRTGRRAETTPNCTFLATDDAAALQAAAITRLFESGFVEPAAPVGWAPHIFAHQVIALAMQERGVAPRELAGWQTGCAAFAELAAADRDAILHHMLAQEILVQADERLLLGPRGERLYGARNFLELYAVFSTPRSIRVVHGALDVGAVDAAFLQDDRLSGSFVLGGRPWRVLHVDWRAGTCGVEPAEEGRYPRWSGHPVLLSRALAQAIREVLVTDDYAPYWSKRASVSIARSREEHAFLRTGTTLVPEPDRVRWWTYAGGKGNNTLAAGLEGLLGEKVTSSNFAVTFAGQAALSDVRIRDGILQLADHLEVAAPHATSRAPKVSKFAPCLPEPIADRLAATVVTSLADAQAFLKGELGAMPEVRNAEESVSSQSRTR